MLFAILNVVAGSASAQTVTLDGNRPAEASSLTARAAVDRPLKLHVSFRLRNRAALTKLLTDLQDPASPQYHHWLTQDEFNSRFGRKPAEVKAVAKWFSAHGMQMEDSSNREITLTATVREA
jgi:subtilase family serine protease